MPILIPEAVKDSVPIFLRAEDLSPRADSIRWDFGQFEYLDINDNGILFKDSIIDNSYRLISKGVEGSLTPFSLDVGSALFVLFLLSFIIFSFFFSRERVAIIGNFSTIFSKRKRPAAGYKEQVTTSEVWGESFMIFQAILILSIVVLTYIWTDEYAFISFRTFLLSFVSVFILMSIIAGLKFLMYRFIALFFLRKDFKEWISRYFRLLELIGIVMFLPAIIYVYLPEIRDSIQILIISIIVISRLIVMIELLNIFVKNKIGGFYFFMYLCGTEIAPYFIYYKGVVLLITIAGNNII